MTLRYARRLGRAIFSLIMCDVFVANLLLGLAAALVSSPLRAQASGAEWHETIVPGEAEQASLDIHGTYFAPQVMEQTFNVGADDSEVLAAQPAHKETMIESACFRGNGLQCLGRGEAGCVRATTEDFCGACEMVRQRVNHGELPGCQKAEGYRLLQLAFARGWSCQGSKVRDCHCDAAAGGHCAPVDDYMGPKWVFEDDEGAPKKKATPGGKGGAKSTTSQGTTKGTGLPRPFPNHQIPTYDGDGGNQVSQDAQAGQDSQDSQDSQEGQASQAAQDHKNSQAGQAAQDRQAEAAARAEATRVDPGSVMPHQPTPPMPPPPPPPPPPQQWPPNQTNLNQNVNQNTNADAVSDTVDH